MKYGLLAVIVLVLSISMNKHILSLFDGVTLVDLKTISDKNNLASIKLSADIALRIVRGICGNLSPEGMPYFSIYEDREAFYFLIDQSGACSYDAKNRGLTMRKSDGRILLPGTAVWVQSGYINMRPSEFHSIIQQGMSSSDVETIIGKPYRQKHCIVVETNVLVSQDVRIDEYICHNKTEYLMINENACVTNLPKGTTYVISISGGLPFFMTDEL
jgi:hypothetical protein